MNNLKYNLLDDNAIDISIEGNDLLGNDIYADMLVDIVEDESKDNNVETVALTGPWGAGKSSIINSFKSKLAGRKINGKNIRVEVYNAWKYSKDDFRKAFLIDAEKDTHKKKELEKSLYLEVTSSKYTFRDMNKWGCLIIVLGFLLTIAICLFGCSGLAELIQGILNIAGISIAGAAIWMIKAIISEEQVTYVKKFSTHDFSRKFGEIIKKSEEFNVFIIDDLDRCRADQALDILEIIHSYLKNSETNNYIFIVPIDQNRLSDHLKNARNFDNTATEQYFNKIFDIQVDIQNPGRMNLYEMLKNLNEQNNFKLSSFSLSIIADFLVNTPRDVKKHLNRINTERMLFDSESRMTFRKKLSDKEIVKLYTLKNVWKENYESLINKYNLFDDINQELISLSENNKNNEDESSAQFKRFVTSTKSIDISEIKHYEYFRVEDMPQIALLNAVMDNALDIITHKSDAGEWSMDEIASAVIYLYDVYVIERNLGKEYIWSIASTYLWIIEKDEHIGNHLIAELDFRELIASLETAHLQFQVEEQGQLKTTECWEMLNEQVAKCVYDNSEKTFIRDNIGFLLDTLISTGQITLVTMLLRVDTEKDILQYQNKKRADLISFAVNSGEANDILLAKALCDCDFENIDEETIDRIIDYDYRSTIIVISLKMPILLSGKFTQILENLKIEDFISQNPASFEDDEFEQCEQFILELCENCKTKISDDINQIISNYKNEVYRFVENIASQAETKKLENILSMLLQILTFADESQDHMTRVFELLNIINKSGRYRSAMYGVIDQVHSLELRANLIVSLAGLTNFDEKITDILFKESDSNNYLTESMEHIFAVIQNKANQTHNIKNVAEVYFNYDYASGYFLNNCWKLNHAMFERCIDVMDINNILSRKELMEHIKCKQMSVKERLIDKIDNFEQCEILYQYVPHNQFRKKYHQKTRQIIDNASNCDLLYRIHNNENTDYDELRWIYEKMERDFPNSDRKPFTKIPWSAYKRD